MIGSILAGYDGHRGWLYSVAVHADYRRHGLGSSLVRYAEQALTALGCMKINLQITSGNDAVAGFYEALGYGVEPRISMGKKIAENIPTAEKQRVEIAGFGVLKLVKHQSKPWKLNGMEGITPAHFTVEFIPSPRFIETANAKLSDPDGLVITK